VVEEVAAMVSPRPWRWLTSDELGSFQELGRIVDANGDTVLDFGNTEPYYPSAGEEPSSEDAAWIIEAVNNYKP